MQAEDWLANDWAAANRRLGSGSSDTPRLDLAKPQRTTSRRSGIWFTRLWALVKMGSLAASTWWAMSLVHAHLGTIVCAYGAVALFSGVGARWRKRYFGPGQMIEPELYEALGSLLYRVGVGLVLIGGLLVVAAPALRA